MWLSVVIVLVICALIVVSKRKAVKGLMPPEYPGALPFIGHGHLFIYGDLFGLWREISMTGLAWGGVVGFKMGAKQIYMISNPEDCLTIANTCLEKDYNYKFLKAAMGEGLLTGKVSTWKTHRKLLAPAFNQAILDGFIKVFNSQSQRLVANLDQHSNGKPFDPHEIMDQNALETICLTAMGGANANELLSDKFLVMREKTQEILHKRIKTFWLHSDIIYNLSPLKKSFDEMTQILRNGSYSVIQKKRDELRKDTSKINKPESTFKTFIDLVMEDYGEKGIMTDQEIREEVDTFILTGHETTALGIIYTLLLLGSHPEVQERAFKEISEVIGERGVEKADLSKLVYLEAVTKESLRLYPIAPFIAREITEDIQIKNYTLPAGSSAYLPLYTLHRHASWGPDAEQFVPERWLEKRIPEHVAAYVPFSIGKRNCIGKTYAMMSLKTSLAYLVRKFRFTSDISKLKCKIEVILKPASGQQITIERRK